MGDAAKQAISKLQVRTLKKGDKVREAPKTWNIFYIRQKQYFYGKLKRFFVLVHLYH